MEWLRRLFNIPSKKQKTERGSSEPNHPGFIEVKGQVVNGGRIRLEADWDEEFIQHLRKNGFSGSSDDQIIQKYLAVMHSQLLPDFKEKDNEYK